MNSVSYQDPWKDMIQGFDTKTAAATQTPGGGDATTSMVKYLAGLFRPLYSNDDPSPSTCFLECADGKRVYTVGDDSIPQEVISDSAIVEFRYDKGGAFGHRWKPIRIRHDKMAKNTFGMVEFGNNYKVADANWQSIHHPVTESMLFTGHIDLTYALQEYLDYSFSYYDDNLKMKSKDMAACHTMRLRKFHNRVKEWVLNRAQWESVTPAIAGDVDHDKDDKDDNDHDDDEIVSGAGGAGVTTETSLIDFAMGVGGDIDKWQKMGFSFVLGIDISYENIRGKDDGACVRYIKRRSQNCYPNMFLGLFLVGDSSKNIRFTQEAFPQQLEDQRVLAKAVFEPGQLTAEEKKTLPSPILHGDVALMGRGVHGFHMSSCQFAIHYFFKDMTTLHSFLRNVAECTMVGGYFTGTFLDGKQLYRELYHKTNLVVFRNGPHSVNRENDDDNDNGDNYPLPEDPRIFQMTKRYENVKAAADADADADGIKDGQRREELPDDERCLGKIVRVYQESINKGISEYLVNFAFLEQELAKYGFKKVESGCRRFSDLWQTLEPASAFAKHRIESRGPHSWDDWWNMSPGEKFVSDLNYTFVFERVASLENVSPAEISKKAIWDSQRNTSDMILPSIQDRSTLSALSPPSTRKETEDLTKGKQGESAVSTTRKRKKSAAPVKKPIDFFGSLKQIADEGAAPRKRKPAPKEKEKEEEEI
jgi:hypothetical protein